MSVLVIYILYISRCFGMENPLLNNWIKHCCLCNCQQDIIYKKCCIFQSKQWGILYWTLPSNIQWVYKKGWENASQNNSSEYGWRKAYYKETAVKGSIFDFSFWPKFSLQKYMELPRSTLFPGSYLHTASCTGPVAPWEGQFYILISPIISNYNFANVSSINAISCTSGQIKTDWKYMNHYKLKFFGSLKFLKNILKTCCSSFLFIRINPWKWKYCL